MRNRTSKDRQYNDQKKKDKQWSTNVTETDTKLRNMNPTNTGASNIMKPSKCIAIHNAYINNQ